MTRGCLRSFNPTRHVLQNVTVTSRLPCFVSLRSPVLTWAVKSSTMIYTSRGFSQSFDMNAGIVYKENNDLNTSFTANHHVTCETDR
jgi:hypothetical protein